MSSTFTWLDYSERERRQFDEIIGSFSQRETRDELGLCTVRDSFAEMLFPGVSTIQTRARYFLFVPWIYREIERCRERPAAARGREREVKLINALARSSDTRGVIGIDARAALKRLPSSIYWQGLGAWGIRLFPEAQDEYHRLLDTHAGNPADAVRTDDGEVLEGDAWRHWHPGLPAMPRGFPSGASFSLTCEEAGFLRERILSRQPGTLLAFLVDHGQPCGPVDFPWEHPQFGEMPPAVCDLLHHARNFSDGMFGAALLYNLMLADKIGNADWSAVYQDQIGLWSGDIQSRRSDLIQWRHGMSQFWRCASQGGAAMPLLMRRFVETWLDIVLVADDAADVANMAEARQLIYERECGLKRDQARLTNQNALQQWTGAAGVYRHNYRWPAAQRILRDILAGLAAEDASVSA